MSLVSWSFFPTMTSHTNTYTELWLTHFSYLQMILSKAEMYWSSSDWISPCHSHGPNISTQGRSQECSWTSQNLQNAWVPRPSPLCLFNIPSVCSWNWLLLEVPLFHLRDLKPQRERFTNPLLFWITNPNRITSSCQTYSYKFPFEFLASSITIVPGSYLLL